MPVRISDSRWKVAPGEMAVRIIIPDLKGWFEKLPIIGSFPKTRSLIIEPGTRSVIIEDGALLGEIYAGEYTLESFFERLQFGRNKQSTVFLTRSEEVAVNSRIGNIPSIEGVCFDVDLLWTVQVNNVLLFMENLMGANEEISLLQLEKMLAPTLHQAIRDTIGQMKYESILASNFTEALVDGIRSRIDVKWSRYGISFIDIQSVAAKPQDGGISARQGELWLKSRENQLLNAASDLENDQLAATAEDMRKKVEIRDQLRTAVSEDRLNSVKNKDEFQKALSQIDHGRLLRQEDHEMLVAAYEERKEDREQQRKHLLNTIDLQREQELEELRLAIDYAVRTKSLNSELELSRLSRTLEGEKWQAELERQRDEASHRQAQRHAEIKSRWEAIREARRQRRDDSWDDLLEVQRRETIQADLEISRTERKRQLTIVQAELETRLAHEKLEMQKRQELWEIESREKKSSSQLERLQRIQEMNAQYAERQHRLQMEMENLKADGASKRELDRIQAMSGLGTEVLIATAGQANAELLADLKKHQATQDAAIAQASANPAEELNAERLKMYEQMNSTERAKAEAIAEAYKAAMLAQQSSVQQMISGLAQSAKPAVYPGAMPGMMPTMPGMMPTMPGMMPPALMPTAGPPPMAEQIAWYVSIDGQQSAALQWFQVQQYLQSGQITASTMVWKSGLPSWLPANQIPELASCLKDQPGSSSMAGPMNPPGPPPL